MDKKHQLMGYRRPDGTVGCRNKVIILPVDGLSNTAAAGVAKLIPGTVALSHGYGRLQFGEDLDLLFRTLIGTGLNPNVAAVVVIGLDPVWTKIVADGIAKSGKPVFSTWLEGNGGDLKVIEQASRVAKKFMEDASELVREPVDRSEIILTTKDGESDTTTGLGSCRVAAYVIDRWIDDGGTVVFGETSELTGGEHLIAERCIDDEVRSKFQRLYDNYIALIEGSGANLLGSQPTAGNILGGISTIEEKAMGNIVKTGRHPLVGALEKCEWPTRKGLHFMDTSSSALECVTTFTAGGGVLCLFPTGRGIPIGNPIQPVIKINANPETVEEMADHIDVDCSDVLSKGTSIEEAGERLLDMTVRTFNGRLTAAETLGHVEFVMTKLYQTA